MTVESIMSLKLKKLGPADKVGDALRVMHKHHIRNLPVVNESSEFIGLFGIRQLIRVLLPKAAQIRHGLEDLSFMPDELGELNERLNNVVKKPVVHYLEEREDLLFCEPSTPLPEVLELLLQSFNTSLPVIVVEGKRKKLVGIVSSWDVLENLAGHIIQLDADP